MEQKEYSCKHCGLKQMVESNSKWVNFPHDCGDRGRTYRLWKSELKNWVKIRRDKETKLSESMKQVNMEQVQKKREAYFHGITENCARKDHLIKTTWYEDVVAKQKEKEEAKKKSNLEWIKSKIRK